MRKHFVLKNKLLGELAEWLNCSVSRACFRISDFRVKHHFVASDLLSDSGELAGLYFSSVQVRHSDKTTVSFQTEFNMWRVKFNLGPNHQNRIKM